MPRYSVPVSDLRIGVFIELPSGWMDHPFFFSKFKIKNQRQIEILRQMGIGSVTCVPEKSDQLPRPPAVEVPKAAAVALDPADTAEDEPACDESVDEAISQMREEKKERRERQRRRWQQVNRCEHRFQETVRSVKNVMKQLRTRPDQSIGEATSLVNDIVDSMLAEKDIVVQLMSAAGLEEGVYYHSLNVTMLSLLLGRELQLDQSAMRELGLGAMLHDIGTSRIPAKIMLKKEPLNRAERSLYEFHVKYGEEIAAKMAELPPGALAIVSQHHETLNGKGYPRGLHGDQISQLAQIVAIANVYDNHCNHIDPADSLTPYEALSHMFKRQQSELNPEMLARFIRCLGVYPPGSIVELSNDMVGMVISVNSANLLLPSLVLYDPNVPKDEALLLDLADDPEIHIVNSIRPGDLPLEVYEYLNPRTRVTYYVDTPDQPSSSAP